MQGVHHLFAGVFRIVGQESVQLLHRGRQAEQVEAHAAQPTGLVGGFGKGQAALLEAAQGEVVDGVADELLGLDRGQVGPLRLNVGPVVGVLSALLYPATQGFDLGLGQAFALWRHAVLAAIGHATDHFAVVGLARSHRRPAGFPSLVGELLEIEAQLALLLVQTVALEAMLRQNGADFQIEVHAVGRRKKANACHPCVY
ncbi:uncharacterized protein METZ01_LOCUS249799 [marine metagenome]|uniref:Uncharacterized protein n=1 Tax=marine metagenome TaxID=408172 RepID=A0A382IC56_9ZZZZ